MSAKSLIELDYENRKLTFLPPSFSSFYNRNINRLILSNNLLQSIPDQTLDDFANLISIYLTNNRLETIDRQLSEIRTLRVLCLGGNLIQTIKNEDFLKLKNLRILKLSDNNLASIEPLSFTPMINLTHLYLKNCNIGLLKPPIFANNIHLKYLYLNNSNLEIEKGLFRPLKNLKKLNLSSNQLDQLDVETFKGLTRLEILNLKANRVWHLENGLLDDSCKLRKLDVSQNNVREIDSGFFRPLRSLSNLLLDGCHPSLNVREMKMFANNDSLKFLTLSCCENFPIETIGNLKWFYFDSKNVRGLKTNEFNYSLGAPNFIILRISDSFLSLLELQTIFDRCSSLIRLDLTNSVVTEPLKNYIFAKLECLQELILDRIQIYDLNITLFVKPNELRTLSLKSCEIFTIDPKSFRFLSKLKFLYLNDNLLVPPLNVNVFGHLKKLQHLDLSNCQISSLPNEIFCKNQHLNCLRFEHNCLPKISLTLFANARHFTHFSYWNRMKLVDNHTNDRLVFEPIPFDFAK